VSDVFQEKLEKETVDDVMIIILRGPGDDIWIT
jgi:hypothetical protein